MNITTSSTTEAQGESTDTFSSWTDPTTGCVHQGPVLAQVDQFSVVDCAHCKYRHVLPLPSDDDLATVYSHEYYSQEKPLYIEHYLQDKEWWDEVYSERLGLLEQYLPAERRSLLDVGSGPGLFLAKGRERGWKVQGVEPSSQAAQYSREALGLTIHQMFLTAQTAETLGHFDAINLGEVLEHLPDPAAMLRLVRTRLSEQGLLCVIVPNDFNPFQNILREHAGFKPWWVAPPHHLNYFNRESLAKLVQAAGFEVLHQESTFPIDVFLMMGQNYIGDSTVGRQAHGQRKQFERLLFKAGAGQLKRDLYQAFSRLGLGRELVLIARKCV